jgi:cell division protease FtsH
MSAQVLPPDANRPQGGWLRWALLVALLGFLLYASMRGTPPTASSSVRYGDFYRLVEEGRVARVTFRGDEAVGEMREGTTLDGRAVTHFKTRLPSPRDEALLPLLREHRVTLDIEPSDGSSWIPLVLGMLPWVLILGFWLWMSRQARGALSDAGSLGRLVRGKAHRFDSERDVSVRMSDVAGLDSAKRELGEVIEFLRHPEPFQKLGVRIPRGLLLVGPPGTGKTLLARAVAGEAGVPFFSISGSSFIEMFVGVGAARVRELFAECKRNSPAIVFIDEIDAVGRARGTGLGGGHDEREQTLNQLLNEMDGFERNDRTVVLAATNRPDVLDAALLRAGRFDRQIVLDRPAWHARKAILEVHARGKPLAADVDLAEIARATPGFSGADLSNLVNEAAIRAARRFADVVTRADFDSAMERIVLGEVRETALSAKEKRRVAVHESGHVLVAFLEPHGEPPRRVSILPRGTSLGATQQRVDTDRYIVTKRELEAKLRVLMAGYAAERTVFDDVSTGAEDDLKKASRIAQQMVSSFGMSEAIGPMHLELQSEHPFLGRRVAEEAQVSDATIYGVEQESRRLLVAALEVASEQLARHAGALEELVAALLDQETLDEDALLALLRRTVSSVPPERVASPAPRATNGQPTIEPEA